MIRITITSAPGEGKTRFIRDVLRPALVASGYTVRLEDGGLTETWTPAQPAMDITGFQLPVVDIVATNDPSVAVKHILGDHHHVNWR